MRLGRRDARLRRPSGTHPVRRHVTLANPLPHPPPAIVAQTARLAIIHQPIQNRCHRRQRILMSRQNCRSISLQLHANLPRSQRTLHFHQHPAASLGKPRLTSVRLAVDQFQQVVVEQLCFTVPIRFITSARCRINCNSSSCAAFTTCCAETLLLTGPLSPSSPLFTNCIVTLQETIPRDSWLDAPIVLVPFIFITRDDAGKFKQTAPAAENDQAHPRSD